MHMSTRPNMVVIVSDTFRRDHLGAFGNTNIHTPHLDGFARSSVLFDRHIISSFPTMPARADILTGTFSYTYMGWEPLPHHVPTLPGLLSEAGYLTVGVVDTPFFIRNGFGYDRGFDDFIWVRGQGDDTRPHEPWDAPEYYTSLYRAGYEGRQIYPSYGRWEEAGLTQDDVDLAHATYCGEVTMVDFWIGRLLAKLDVLGLAENTLVFFTSDHGFYFGEHGYFGKAEWINDQDAAVTEGSVVPDWLPGSWLLTVGWSPLYRELTNVPLMIRVPGLEPSRRPALTTAPDLAPTILDLVGVERPGAMQGESFGDVLVGEKDEHRPFVVSSWPLYFAAGEFTTAVDSRPRRIASYMPMTVTTRERSLILGGPAYMPELYEFGRDPGEQSNVWESRIEEGAALGERALSFLEREGTPELYLDPRRLALQRFAPDWSAPTLLDTKENQMH